MGTTRQIDVDAAAHLRALVETHGTQRAVAKRLGYSEVYVSDLLAGRRAFSDAMLAKLGLRRTIVAAKG